MDKQQKKQTRKYISFALAVILVVFLACLPMIASNDQPETGPQASILTAQVARHNISEAILGGGTLITDDTVEITIPVEVKIKEYLVQNGDIVAEGQEIAKVDRVSVMSAITQVQETLEEIRAELNKSASSTESTKVNAKVGGTVKIVYGSEGERVQDVILRDGALAVLSLDDLMAVRISRSTSLSGGDAVCVTLSDGTEVEGKVESNLEGILTVTMEDKDYRVGDTVKVTTTDGDRIGSGTLYIHNQWNVLAYSGTISRVRTREGATVSAGSRLFDLTDTGHTAQYDALSRQHRQYEELMLELFEMYQSETVTSPQAGLITGADEAGTYMLADSAGGWKLSLLANAPNGNDEATYTNYVGQVTEVGSDGLIIRLNPNRITVNDYKDLSGVPTDTALMTYQTIYWSSAPVYQLSGGEWTQISASSIAAGDILLFSGTGGTFVWVIRLGSGTLTPGTPQQPDTPSTEPTEPSAPTEPGQSGSTTTPVVPGGQGGQGGKVPQATGRFPSMGGSAPQEAEEETYSMETATIASVTAQGDATVQISVDELDISKVHVGQSVTITLDALPGETFTGTVANISAEGANEGGNSKFTVDISVAKSENMLAGMTAHVRLVLRTEESVTGIPVAALTDKGTETIVYTGYDEESGEFTNPQPVITGLSDGGFVQILSGLTEGQTIYYPYYDTLVISNIPESGGFRFMG